MVTRRKPLHPRPSLVATITDDRHDLVLIQASNGTGKSSLLERQVLPALAAGSYIELSERHADRSLFINTVLEGINPNHPPYEDAGLSAIKQSSEYSEGKTLIIDTLEVIADSRSCIGALVWMIQQWPNCRFILAGRSLEHLRELKALSDNILELGDEHLNFSAIEIAAMAQNLELEIDATRIYAETGGWPIIVDKVLRGARSGRDPVEAIKDQLSQLPQSYVRWLAPLALIEPWEAITPALLGLEERPQYIDELFDYHLDVREIAHGVYQPHRLFCAALTEYLEPELVEGYRIQIAQVYESAGREIEAFELLIDTKEREKAVRIARNTLIKHAQQSNDESLRDRLLSELTEDELGSKYIPVLADQLLQYDRFDDGMAAMKRLEQRVANEQADEARSPKEIQNTTWSKVDIAKLYLTANQFEHATNAYATIEAANQHHAHEVEWLDGLCWQMHAKLARQRYEQMPDELKNTSQFLHWAMLWTDDDTAATDAWLENDRSGSGDQVLFPHEYHNYKALVCGFKGDFEHAFKHIRKGIALAMQQGPYTLINALNSEGELHTISGNLSSAIESFERAERVARDAGSTIRSPGWIAIQLKAQLGRIEPAAALELVMADQQTAKRHRKEHVVHELVCGLLWLQLGQFENAIAALDTAENHSDAIYRLRAHQANASAHAKSGRPYAGNAALERLQAQFGGKTDPQHDNHQPKTIDIYIKTLGHTTAFHNGVSTRLTPKNCILAALLEQRTTMDTITERYSQRSDKQTEKRIRVLADRLRERIADIGAEYGLMPKECLRIQGSIIVLHPMFNFRSDFRELAGQTPERIVELHEGLLFEDIGDLETTEWISNERRNAFLEFELAALSVARSEPQRAVELFERLERAHENDLLELGDIERSSRYLKRIFELHIGQQRTSHAMQTLKNWERKSQEDPLKYEAPTQSEYEKIKNLRLQP